MAKKAKCECPAGEKWAVPYADFLSLLLALFIALFAISSTASEKSKAYKQAVVNFFNNPPPSRIFQPIIQRPPDPGKAPEKTDGQKPNNADGDAPSISTQQTISQVDMLTQQGGVLEQVEEGVLLKLPTDLLFEQGKAHLSTEDMKVYIRRMADLIKTKLPKEIRIEIRGYTDDSPLDSNSIYADHYMLAADRAYSVLLELVKNGVSPEHLTYSSSGKFHPRLPNTTEENRAKNNRVEIYIITRPNSVGTIKSILDSNLGNTQIIGN